MSDLGWRADGIARAIASGGVVLEKYRKPGFSGNDGVRLVPDPGGSAQGFELYYDPDPGDYEMQRPRKLA